jgi:LacI family transcriptional regulator
MAGLMMARLGAVRGTVVAVCHSQIYRVHRDRIAGFSAFLQGHAAPGLHFAHVAFGRDDPAAGAALVRFAAQHWPDLAGLYNAGGGNSGLLEALRSLRRKVFFVGHELNATTAAALGDGTADVILDQHPEAQARRAVDLLLSRLGLIGEPVDNPPIRFTTVTAQNL